MIFGFSECIYRGCPTDAMKKMSLTRLFVVCLYDIIFHHNSHNQICNRRYGFHPEQTFLSSLQLKTEQNQVVILCNKFTSISSILFWTMEDNVIYKIMQYFSSLQRLVFEILVFEFDACHGFVAWVGTRKLFVGCLGKFFFIDLNITMKIIVSEIVHKLSPSLNYGHNVLMSDRNNYNDGFKGHRISLVGM